MRHLIASLAPAAASLLLLACAPGGRGAGLAVAQTPPASPASPAAGAPAQSPDREPSAAPSPAPARDRAAPPREANPDDALCAPLLIEPDLVFGTHVVMRRLPTAADL